MKILLAIIILCLLFIAYNQMQEVAVQPVTEPAAPEPQVVIEQQTPELRRVLREHIYWQESPEYYHWRTSVKTSIEDAAPPEYSGRWVRKYYWTYEQK